MEEKILSLYACGMSQGDISEQIRELYDVDISPELVTKVSKKIMPEVYEALARTMPELGSGTQSASADVCRPRSQLIPLRLDFPGVHCGIHACGAHTTAHSRKYSSQGKTTLICPVSQPHS